MWPTLMALWLALSHPAPRQARPGRRPALRRPPSRPRLEHLEDRCTPGSALDLLADPPLAPLGQSLLSLEASETPISRLLSGERTLSLPSQAASPASRSTPADPGLPDPFASPAGSGLHNLPAPLQGPATPPLAGEVVSASARDAQGEQVP